MPARRRCTGSQHRSVNLESKAHFLHEKYATSKLAGREHYSVRWGAAGELIAGGVLPGTHRARGKVDLDLTGRVTEPRDHLGLAGVAVNPATAAGCFEREAPSGG
jgi:hypothetical protein